MHNVSNATEPELLQRPFTMRKSVQEIRLETRGSSDSEEDDGNDHADNQHIVVPTRAVAVADSFEKKDHSWLVASPIPTDLSIQIQDITFSVHKYPLLSKCGYIGRLELQPSISNFGYELKLENFPGGPETFETILEFCYGLPFDLKPTNIAPLRCAADFLEMSEELEDGNLIAKTEAFLTFVILSSWRDTINALKSCEILSPWAENLQIVRRCCDSIAWKASRGSSTTADHREDEGWWFYDVATLRIDHFMRIVTTIRAKGMEPEIVGKCIIQYASQWLPMDMEYEGIGQCGNKKNGLHFSLLSGSKETSATGNSKEHRTIIESLISILPPQQEAVPCSFLLKMLNMAILYSASPAFISELEKRVGMVLESANVHDLLMRNYKNEDKGNMAKSAEQNTLHNIEVVQRILEYFLMHEQEQQQMQPTSRKSIVSKLLDIYLAEIAKDPNLSVTQFQVLAECLPQNARTCDDGLYRAIDTYLKTHPSLSEHDRRRLCKLMNCEKLSADACMHAAQNDRLPLRTVIQVLYAEQVKMRTAMHGKEQATTVNNPEQQVSQTSTRAEIMSLKTELANVRMEMAELQRDYSQLQYEYEKLNSKHRNLPGWILGWKKIRKSAFFHRRVDEDEPEDAQQRPTGHDCRINSRRRQSIA